MLAALAVLFAGCSSEPYKVAKVSGLVTFDGKPLPNAEVMFQPEPGEGSINPGPGSAGTTNSEGRYTLKVIGKDTNGAVVGKHKVRITMAGPSTTTDSSDDRPKRTKPAVKIPARYNGKDTVLKWEVSRGGTDSANFELTSK
jgi:hypothetical protein